MSDIVKRTAFYEVRKYAGRDEYEYKPFYRVEVNNNNFSQLFQPANFSPRVLGTATQDRIAVHEYKQVTPHDRFFMDGDRQLMKFESCQWPVR